MVLRINGNCMSDVMVQKVKGKQGDRKKRGAATCEPGLVKTQRVLSRLCGDEGYI